MNSFDDRKTAPKMRTAHEYAKSMVRDAILEGDLAPGTRLMQTDLANKLGISTTPIREALRDLTIEGLVQMDAHRGAVVRNLDIREVEEIYELRMLLEPVMIRRKATSIDANALAEAEMLHKEMENETDQQTWAELNRRFHSLLEDGDDPSRLGDFLRSLRNSSTPWVRLSLDDKRIAESQIEHQQLLDLYHEQNVEAIVETTLNHLRQTLALIQQRHTEQR